MTSLRRDRYDALRELRALRRRALALSFPAAPREGQGYHNWKIPVRCDGWRRWTPRADPDIVKRLDLHIPAGFALEGFDTAHRDDDPPREITGGIWLIGEGRS